MLIVANNLWTSATSHVQLDSDHEGLVCQGLRPPMQIPDHAVMLMISAQAAKVSRNCELLLKLMKQVDRQLANALHGMKTGGGNVPLDDDTKDALQELAVWLVKGGKQMKVISDLCCVFMHSRCVL